MVEKVVRTVDDENFIDDSGVDPADRYDNDNGGHSPRHYAQEKNSELASSMLLTSNVSAQKTYYEVLSVNEGATYDEIRVGYRSAILNVHPDKSEARPDSVVPSGEHGEFLSAQKAWEVLRDPNSRGEYDKQLQTSRQNLETVAYEIEVEEMTIESSDHEMELLYPCRCGDYFSISSFDLGEMGILIDEDRKIDFQSSDCVSASVVLGCCSCSLKTRLVINRAS